MYFLLFQLLDPAEYLNCEINSSTRGHSFSKYDKRATKSTTDLTKGIIIVFLLLFTVTSDIILSDIICPIYYIGFLVNEFQ